MFDLIRRNTKILMFILVVLIIPSFVLLGLEGYTGFGARNQAVAEVAGSKITQAEWDAAHRSNVERLRARSPDIDVRLLDTPEMRQQTLEALVRQRVTLIAADKLNLYGADERVQRMFRADPDLAFLRKPDGSLNADILNAQGMSAAQFEQKLRQDVAMWQVLDGVSATAVAPVGATHAALDALLQQREVRIARFEAKNYIAGIQPTDEELAAYHADPAHASLFELPERVSIEYLVLDLDTLKSGLTVSEDDLRQFYKENEARYSTPEERRASHILVKTDAGASAADREQAKAKAQGLLDQLKQDPKRFAELAKQHSDDPGSAARGGDLDFFGRGAMVKPFEDAAYALEVGALSDLVESDFGYHVIQVTGKRGGEKRSFEDVRPEIEAEAKQQLAQRRYAEAAETFSNTVYEQADSLKPAADALKLKVHTVTDVTRNPVPGATGPLANAKFLEALFSDDAVRNKRNTEALEIGPSQLASGRVVEHAPARKRPLEETKDLVRERVIAERAATLARQAGEAKLAAWKAGEAPGDALDQPLIISRAQGETLPRVLIESVMKASPDPLPSWTGVDFGEPGYAVVRIDRIVSREAAPDEQRALQRQYAQLWGEAEALAYYAALRTRYKTKIIPQPVAADEPATR